MKQFLSGIFSLILLSACSNDKKIIVSPAFIDSVFTQYGQPQTIQNNNDEIDFWKNRINLQNPGIVNELKYASALTSRFLLSGNIMDLKKSDSVLNKIVADFNGKEAAAYLSLIRNALIQHQFKYADSLFQLAQKTGVKKYEAAAIGFDINFELGKIIAAETNLKNIQAANDYGYQFRQSKMMHYKGELDSSIAAMQVAVALAGTDNNLRQIALSNLADLYVHAGELEKAYHFYLQCVRTGTSDLHSMIGVGWIALVHDDNDSLAERILKFVQTKTKSPDPLFKLTQVAEKRKDSILQLKYANEFVATVTDTAYGNMYNKYLIQLYTGVLHQPAIAENIAKKELTNRATPQTYAWYAWTLLCNNKTNEAYTVYQKNVSGKPLEGLELYWMGKLMQQLNKGYNAQQFFKEANKNKYDLSPSIVQDLDKILEE